MTNGNSDMTNGEKERLFRDIGYIKAKLEDLLDAQREHRRVCSKDMGEIWGLARTNENDITQIKAISRKQGAATGGVVAGGLVAAWEIVKAFFIGRGG